MSEVGFLVGETIAELREETRMVFKVGDKPEPLLYADVSECFVADRAGVAISLGSLVGRTVTATSTFDDTLRLTFDDGSTLSCGPAPDYEAWQVVGGDPQYLVVCLPGGELAIWGTREGQ